MSDTVPFTALSPTITAMVESEVLKAVQSATPNLQQTAQDLVAAEVKAVKTSPLLQDVVIVTFLLVVIIICLSVLFSALAGNLYARSLVAQAWTSLAVIGAWLSRALSPR